MGTTAAQKKLFFNLRKLKGQLQAFEDGDLHPDQVKAIATKLGVPEEDVISMNRRLAGDFSLNAPLRADADGGEWQDWLVDDGTDQEIDTCRPGRVGQPPLLSQRCDRHADAAREADLRSAPAGGRPADAGGAFAASSASAASASGRSRSGPSRRCRRRSSEPPKSPRRGRLLSGNPARAFSVPIELERGSSSLFGRIFSTQTGIHPRLRGDMLCRKRL